jgi:D-alanyl-D-alanine-carboxypeptidase/D-alanyl-D-alanine-endopeptidase
MKTEVTLLSLSLFLLISLSASAQTKPLAEVAEAFAGQLPAGCIVTGEWRGSTATYTLVGKGIQDLAAEDHLFEIGSISKVFTGLLLAQAVIDQKVSLTTSLRDLFGPDFVFADPNVAAITLEQLSTHTSGLPRLPANMGLMPGFNPDPYAAYGRNALHAFVSAVTLSGPGPHPAAYSNLGVGLLGDLLAALENSSWEQLVIERIAKPLGMNQTRVTLDAGHLKRLAPPFQGSKPGSNWHFQALAGAGALIASAADLMRFGQALLAPDATPFPEAIRLMLAPRCDFAGESRKIGLGIILTPFLEEPSLYHDGRTGGYRSFFQVQPASQSIRIILTNNSAFAPPTLLNAIAPQAVSQPRPKQALPAEVARE